MNPPSPDLRSIFCEALDRPPGPERSAFLDEACGDDAPLRARVTALLLAHDAAGAFLADPAPPVPSEREGGANVARVVGATLEHTSAPDPPETADVVARPAAEGVGTRIGPYQLLQLLGEGGMGAVYLAGQEKPVRRRVALKVIKPGMDTAQVIARFEAERQALAMMDHPSIAKVLDAGATAAGRPFFVMELVNGVPITEYCDTVHLTPRERLELFIPVCQAVQHAHQKGIIHRDLKPSNVLVAMQDGQPVPKVIDFGIAKATEQRLTERSLFTQHGAIVGTLEYMSPEQAEMSALGVDTRTDVYALGVLLYELLTGTTPLERARLRESGYAEILRRIREEEPPKPSTRLSESREALPSIAARRKTEPARLSRLVRGDLDWIVMKALEKDRTRRYETANGFARDIRRHLDGEAVEASPPSRTYRLAKLVRRNKGPVIAASLLLLVLVGGMIGTSWGLVRAEHARRREAARAEGERLAKQEAVAARGAEAVQRRRAVAALDESRRVSTRFALQRGQQLAEQGQIDLALLWFGRALQLAPEDDDDLVRATRATMAAWSPGLNGIRMKLPSGRGQEAVSFSPDGRTALTLDGDGSARLFDVATGHATIPPIKYTDASRPMPMAYGVVQPAFSPDGRTLATPGDDGTVRLWETAGGRSIGKTLSHGAPLVSLDFRPDGKALMTASGTALRLWDLDSGGLVGDAMSLPEMTRGAGYSRDGRTLMTWGEDAVHLWDAATRRAIRGPITPPGSGRYDLAAFGPDGTSLWTWDHERGATTQAIEPIPTRLLIRDVATGQVRGPAVTLPEGSARLGRGVGMAIHPSGRFLVTGRQGSDPTFWDVATGRPMGKLSSLESGYSAFAFSPDGRLLLAGKLGGGGPALLDVAPGFHPGVTYDHAGQGSPLRMSPDGATLVSEAVTTDQNPSYRFWVAATGRPIGEPIVTRKARPRGAGSPGPIASAFSPDGKTVVTMYQENAARLWDAETGQPRGAILRHEGDIRGVAFSPDGTKVATAGDDGTARLWDAATGSPVGPPLGHQYSIKGVAFSPDGGTLLAWGGRPGSLHGEARLWDVATGRPAGPVLAHQGEVHAAAFSPDGKTIITGSLRLRLWDVATSREIERPFAFTDLIMDVAFRPDGETILARPLLGNLARLFDAATGMPVGPPLQHQATVTTAAFSPDGKIVATAGRDGVARLWDAGTGLAIGPPLECGSEVVGVAFAPDGRSLWTSVEGKFLRWDVPPPLEGERGRLVAWTQVATSYELDPGDAAVPLLVPTETGRFAGMLEDGWYARNRRLIELGGPPGHSGHDR